MTTWYGARMNLVKPHCREPLGPAQRVTLPDAAVHLFKIREQYAQQRDDSRTRKSHYFGGRFENIYIDRKNLPALEPVLLLAEDAARLTMGTEQPMSVGFWFNEMYPGHRTGAHSHDGDDEILSGVFYVSVPENSGDLVLGAGDNKRMVQPVEGEFIFFDPALPHAVTENQSQSVRLSIGMNFGFEQST